ncbi:MAG: nucleotide exchange factor GrpE [Ilumatobacter sp.]|uniref:nucleotide exchange factor GrpE n=1 Tax=Ilumatobacter sp. TaxID=1967498 RepID=UPI003C73C286
MSDSDRDAQSGRPGNTGAGDNFDPDIHDVDDVDLGSPGSTHAGQPDGAYQQQGGDAADERSSEVDDVTEGVHRPAGGLSPEEATQVQEALAAAVDDAVADVDVDVADIDVSEIDVFAVLDERDQFKNMAQRIQADFDNFRKQSAVRAQADADRATGRLAEAMLPVLDAAEAAFLRHPDEVGPLLNQMLVELKKHGLETLDLEGQPFDPEVAEAVAHEPESGGEPVVSEVLRSGYKWKEKTLRAAMVKTKD